MRQTAFPKILFFLLLLFLPTQFGKHFWLFESLVLGRKIDYLSPTIYFTDVILGFLAASLVYRTGLVSLIRQIRQIFLSKVARVLLVYFTIAGWVTLTSWQSWLGVYFLFRFIELFLVVWVVSVLKPTLWEVAWPLGVAVSLSSLLAVAQFLSQQTLGGPFYFLGERTFSAQTVGIAQAIIGGRVFLRPYATFPHPNVLGGFLLTLLPLWLYLPSENRKSKFILKTTTIILTLMGIFISFSRIAWVGAMLVVGVYFFNKTRRSKQQLFLVVVVLLSLLIVEELTLTRLSNLFMVDTESVVERQRLAENAFTMISHSPIFGVGWGRFIPTIPTVSSPPYLLQPVHSTYILLLAEGGIIGLTAVILVLWQILKNLGRSPIFLKSSLLVIGFLGLFDHYFVTLEQTRLLFTLIFALTFMRWRST